MNHPLWPRKITLALAVTVAVLLNLWAAMAIYFDSPLASLRTHAVVMYLVTILAALSFLRRRHKGLVVAFAGFVLVAAWWLSMKPSGDRNWKADYAKTANAEINGDLVTIHNIRNCDYRTEQDFSCQWDVRSYNLANLRGVDLFINWWGSPWIAHPITSFDFGDQGRVATSIETRQMVGQSYSAIRGFFHQYALAYIVSDERDVVRLRTNYRKDEDVYLFRTRVTPTLARKIFLDYLERVNSLHERPEWYNALTNNCTTNIAVSAAEASDIRMRLDWRILLNGKMDEMLYEHNRLVTDGLPFAALKEQAHINAAAKAAGTSPDFSRLIREGRIGFDSNAIK